MKVHRLWNTCYTQFLQTLYQRFPKRRLYNELKQWVDVLKRDPESSEVYDTVDPEIMPHMDAIFALDVSALGNVRPVLNLPELMETLSAEDRQKLVWDRLVSLCRLSSMVKACGSQMANLEKISLGQIPQQPGAKPEEYYMSIIKTLLTSDASGQVLSSLKDPEQLGSLLTNFSNMMRAPGQPALDLSPFLEMMKPKNDEEKAKLDQDFGEFQEMLKSEGSLEGVLKQALGNGDMAGMPEGLASLLSQGLGGAGGATPDLAALLQRATGAAAAAQSSEEKKAAPSAAEFQAMLQSIVGRAKTTLNETLDTIREQPQGATLEELD